MAGEAAERVRFGVLGPLAVWRGGEPVRLGGERQRALLALLLAWANELVSVEVLVDALFGEQPSDGAVHAMRVAVSRLRRLLENGDEHQVLETRAGGYVLALEPEQLDAVRFERLLSDGRGLLSAGDAMGAAARLREALSLWRGAPLADVAGVEHLQGEIRRLEELRLAAVIERIDADLALGAGVELVAELELLIAANPLQERVRGQLMLALYRAGRQTDALAVYREISGRLRDELGLEPGRALQEVERRVLQQDPALDPIPTPSAAATAGNLPTAATAFLGRERELSELTTLMSRADVRLLTQTGAGGSGKTRLALRLAQKVAPDYADGVWFVAFADITDPGLIAPTICRALGLAEQPAITPTQLLKEWLRSRSLLLVLDNLEQLAPHTAILGGLLAACPQLRLLVTSREPLHLAGEQQYEVPVLDLEDAVELFCVRAHAIAPQLTIDDDIAGKICERLDRLPLAIELAAARTKTLPPAEILTRLEHRLPVLSTGPRDAPHRQHTLNATIDWSYDLLTKQEQRLFARLAVFAGGFTLPGAESACDADLDSLQALANRSLIRVQDGRYWMLETVREYALQKLDETGQADELRRRHAQWLIELLKPKSGRYSSRAVILAARPVRELDNLRVALEWAAASGEFETMAWLVDSASFWVWFRQGQLDEAKRWIVRAREHATEFPALLQARVLDDASDLALHRGELLAGAALCEQALAIYRGLGDPEGVCFGLNFRSMFAVAQGDLPGARAGLEEAMLHARANEVPGVLPIALNNLADIAIEEGNLNEARALLEQALTLEESLAAGPAVPLINLAYIANVQGRYTEAARFGREAVNAALGHEDKRHAAEAVIQIAWPLAAQGELERSARLFGAATGFLEAAGMTWERTDSVCQQRIRQLICGRFDPPALERLLDEGHRIPLEVAVRDALTESPARDASLSRRTPL